MKRLLLFLLVLTAVESQAQDPLINKFVKPNNTYGTILNRLYTPYALTPALDTLDEAPQGSIAFKNHTMYYKDTAWKIWTGGGGSSDGNNYPASLSFSNNSLTLTRNGLGSISADWDSTLYHSFPFYNTQYAFKSHAHVASDISDITTYVRNLFTQGTGISYNPLTGVIAWDGSGAGITSFNGLTGGTQTLAFDSTYNGAAGWSSVGTAHTLRLPRRLFDTTLIHSSAYNDAKYQSIGSYVPTSRTITINGTTLDLSANRSWTIASGGTWGSITGGINSQTDLRDSLRARYIGMRQISDTSFALRKWNGTGFTEDTVVIQWADGTFGDVTTTGHRSNFTINSGAVNDSKLSTGINANKIADGSVSNTEFQYLNSVTSNVQTQLDGKQATLVSGTSIKTINGNSLLGSGNITITSSGGSVNDFRLMTFQVDSSRGAPASGSSYFILPSTMSTSKRIFFSREGEEQVDTTNGIKDYQYLRHLDTVFVFPSFTTRERCIVKAFPDSNWTVDNFPAPAGYDTDAQTYFTASGITSTTVKDAINAFVVGLKADGIWSKFDFIHILSNGSEASTKYNLKDPRDLDAAYRLTFVNNATFSSTGVTTNGSSQYINTHYIMSAAGQAASNDYQIGVYNGTSSGVAGFTFGVSDGTASTYGLCRSTDDKSYFKSENCYEGNFSDATTGKGFYIENDRPSTAPLRQVFKDGVQKIAQAYSFGSTTLPTTYPLVFNAYNNVGTIGQYRAGKLCLIMAGKSMTDTELSNLNTLVQTLATAEGW